MKKLFLMFSVLILSGCAVYEPVPYNSGYASGYSSGYYSYGRPIYQPDPSTVIIVRPEYRYYGCHRHCR